MALSEQRIKGILIPQPQPQPQLQPPHLFRDITIGLIN